MLYRLTTESPADNNMCRDIVFAFSNAKRAIVRMTMSKASLEDIFIELTSNEEKVTEENTSEQISEEEGNEQ